MLEGRRVYLLPPHGFTLHVYPSLWTLHDCGFLDTELLLLFLRRHLEARCPSCREHAPPLCDRDDAFAVDEREKAGELLLHAALVGRAAGAETHDLAELEPHELPYPKALHWLCREWVSSV